MPKAYLVAGLGFGDEGKGSIVDYLVQKHDARLVIRYNGGPQAAHNVVMKDGRHHTFSQFGSGTLRGARTYLGRHVLIDPPAMYAEARHLLTLGVEEPAQLMTIHPKCVVVTPYHRAMNRLREMLRSKSGTQHGSCGVGVGEAYEDAIVYPQWTLRAEDLVLSIGHIEEKLRHLQSAKLIEYRMLDPDLTLRDTPEFSDLRRNTLDIATHLRANMFSRISTDNPMDHTIDPIVFEGAQGVLLDRRWGMHPHRSWTDATFAGANEIWSTSIHGWQIERIGVMRTYMTRHGAGPLPSSYYHMCMKMPAGEHNVTNHQGEFRTAPLDIPLLRYSLQCLGPVDFLAVTHNDEKLYDDALLRYHSEHEARKLMGGGTYDGTDVSKQPWDYIHSVPQEFGKLNPIDIQEYFARPVGIISSGPCAEDKSDFREQK